MLGTWFSIAILMWIALALILCLKWRCNRGEGRVVVVVLGDTGRSPRMQYHCVSLLNAGYAVDLVGYGGSRLIPELCNNNLVRHHELLKSPAFTGHPSMTTYFIKVIFLTCNLLWVILRRTEKPSHLLMQTPPSIPTLFVCLLVCWLRSSKFIIDFHNYGHTILALSLGNGHPLVRISRMYEEFLSPFAHSVICVTEAMKRDLEFKLGVSATVFHDRPPSRFKPTEVNQKHKLFLKLSKDHLSFKGVDGFTAFTAERNEKVVMRSDRPFLLISSTSWTEDEDFAILLEALEEYDAASSDKASMLPKVLCVITGKGPMKEYYMKILRLKHFSMVMVCTLWLSAEDYPVLLGSADLGVCLHKSSSGLDLPMKVVDMFGCGLPVCALNFECLSELVTHDFNGMVFSTSFELSAQLQDLCCGFPEKSYKLAQYRKNLSSYQSHRWDHYWRINVLPLISNSYRL